MDHSGFSSQYAFIDKGLKHISRVMKAGYVQWELASREGFFQKLDARIKTLSGLFFIVIVSLKKDISHEAAIASFAFLLGLSARLSLFGFYKRVLLLGFFFGFLIALPSAINIVTTGEIVLPLVKLSGPYDIWIYHVPAAIGITREGIHGVAMLTLRVTNSIAFSLFVLQTTTLPDIIKALKALRVPDIFLMIITLSYKYIFLFMRTVEDMHLAMKGRLTGELSNTEARKWAAGRMAFIFRKTQIRCEEIFKAMTGRGFTGDVKLQALGRMKRIDWTAGAVSLSIGLLFLWL